MIIKYSSETLAFETLYFLEKLYIILLGLLAYGREKTVKKTTGYATSLKANRKNPIYLIFLVWGLFLSAFQEANRKLFGAYERACCL
jgi:hypothetical protein